MRAVSRALVAVTVGALLYGFGKSLRPAIEMLMSATTVPSFYLKSGSSFNPGQIIWICLLAPLAEEMVFRVVLFDVLRRHLPTLMALIITSVSFALAHVLDADAIDLILLFVSGVCYQVERLRLGSVAYPMISHAIPNALIILPKPSIEAMLATVGVTGTRSATAVLLIVASLIVVAILWMERATRAKFISALAERTNE